MQRCMAPEPGLGDKEMILLDAERIIGGAGVGGGFPLIVIIDY